MKVVLDTNVLVSGLMTRGGNSARILDHVVEGHLTACFDDRILDEYQRVCREPELKLDLEAVADFLGFIRDSGERVVAKPLDASVPDPDDLPFIETAVAAAAILVTGNKKHFPAKAVAPVRVLTPVEFVALMRCGGRP